MAKFPFRILHRSYSKHYSAHTLKTSVCQTHIKAIKKKETLSSKTHKHWNAMFNFHFHFMIRYALERMKIAFEKFINKVCTFPCHYQIVKCFIAYNAI